ncbi:MAG: hypothetical protein U0667_08130 [Chloroflexota bacterium]
MGGTWLEQQEVDSGVREDGRLVVGVTLLGGRCGEQASGRMLRSCRDVGQRPGDQHRVASGVIRTTLQALLDRLAREPDRRCRPCLRPA